MDEAIGDSYGHAREVTVHLPETLIEQMSVAANEDKVTLDDLVQSAIEQYLEDDLEDTPDEKILADFREAWREAKSGVEGPTIDEVIAEIRREMNTNAN
jgi:hypothetical protein